MSAIQIKSEVGTVTNPEWLEVVRRQVASLKFGVVQIVIHDSHVKQIEKTERVRLDKQPASGGLLNQQKPNGITVSQNEKQN